MVRDNQLIQRYSDAELKIIQNEAERQHLPVAGFIRKCVLDTIFKNSDE